MLGDGAAREQLLREAERLYLEIGAPLQVERLKHQAAARIDRPRSV